MINSMFALAPSGVLGTGSVDVRPWGVVAVPSVGRPSLQAAIAGVQGTGVPSARDARLREAAPTGHCATPHTTERLDQLGQFNNGTTLGIRFPGRPPG